MLYEIHSIVYSLVLCTLIVYVRCQSAPSSPFLDISVLSGSSIRTKFLPPLTDGGALISSYKLDWDTDPGTPEVQEIVTSVYVGPNDVQTISTSAMPVSEKQVIQTNTNSIQEIQKITVKYATAGYFFLQLDTSATGERKHFLK